MSRTVRPGVLLAALLALALVGPVRHAHALTVSLTGTPADWPAATRIGTDPDDTGGNENRDLAAVFYTNNASTLFFRVDTQGTSATRRTDATMSLALDTQTGGQNAVSAFGPVGTDYVLRITGTTLTPSFFNCTSGSCTQITPIPASFQIGTGRTNQLTEFAIAPAAVGVSSTSTAIGVSVFFSTPTPNQPRTDRAPDTGFFTSTVPGPLPVTLTAFAAERAAEGVTLSWATSSEIGVQGFHLLRSASGQRADAVRITSALIPASGDSLVGAEYRFDDATAPAGAATRYWLEVIAADGSSGEEYGPVAVAGELGSGMRVYLPLVRR